MNGEHEERGIYEMSVRRRRDLDMIKSCLGSLVCFCYTEGTSNNNSMLVNYNNPNATRQNILREQGLFDVCSSILAEAFTNQAALEKVF